MMMFADTARVFVAAWIVASGLLAWGAVAPIKEWAKDEDRSRSTK